MNVESLFFDRDLSATLRAHMEKAKRGANQIPESEFTSGNLNAIATDLYSDFHVAPVELTEGAISVEAQEADIDRRRFSDIDHGFPGESPTLRGTRVTYNVPYVGDPQLFRLKPSTRTNVLPRAVHRPGELRFVYEVRSSDVASTKQAFDKDLELTKRYLGWTNEDVTRFNLELQRAVEGAVSARGHRLTEAAEGLASLGLPVRSQEPAQVRKNDVRSSVPEKGSGKAAGVESYDVALSFAGEDRTYVEAVAEYLKNADVRVFYDKFETTSLWGKDLVEHLQDIYQNRARYCVLFVSEHYVGKPWPTHERRSAQARALVADDEYLLPARFDDTPLPGLPPTIGFVDLRKLEAIEFGKMVLKKLGRSLRDL